MKRNKPFDFDKEIRRHIEQWHKRVASVEELLKVSDDWANEDPLLGVWSLVSMIKDRRRFSRRYLRSRFGYKTGNKGFKSSTRDHIVRPERFPSKGKEWLLYARGFAEWAAYEGAFIMLVPELQKEFSHPDKDTYRAWRKACRQALLEVYAATLLKLRLAKSYADKRLNEQISEEGELAWLSGLVGSQISLERNQRLKSSLEEVDRKASDGLLQELPATTLIECDNLIQKGEPPTKLRNRVAENLASMGQRPLSSEKRAKLEASDSPDPSHSDPLPREFWVKEEVNALIASATLAEREQQILELSFKGRLYHEIADELKITEGTVKRTMHRVRGKLREAAGQ